MITRSETTLSAEGVIYYTRVASPLGPLLLTAEGGALTGLYMTVHPPAPAPGDPLQAWDLAGHAGRWVPDDMAAPFPAARDQLATYFAGRRTVFDLPLALHGTEFQRRVWTALRTIPYGVTITYGDLARQVMGSLHGSRAVGLANGRNPISLIVPCHRVIGSNGKLTGYGGGLPRKAALLDFEFAVRLGGPGPFPPLAG